jgi:hypothetical protein
MVTPNEGQVHHLGSKLSQLLADTLINMHPHVSRLAETEKAAFREQFLEGLEQHTAGLVGPLLSSVAGSTTIPDELSALLTELGMPTEQFTGIISQFFIFGLMFQLGSAMLAPFIQQVNNDIWTAHPDRPLSPPDIATAVVRGIGLGDTAGVTLPGWAESEAAKSGVSPDAFKTMVGVTGMAPSLQLLFEMVRRGIIADGELNGGGTTLVSGIQQSDIKDEWIEAVSKLRYVQPSPVDFVRAAVQAQMPYADAAAWATKVGLEPPGYLEGNPDWFKLLFDTAGRPPGPVEMGHAANRGLIPWDGTGPEALTFQQAIAESDIKTKWTPILKELARYYPPNGEIRTLLLHGGITEDQAKKLWIANGVPAELADAYLHLAQVEQVTQDKALAKGDILTLVQEQAISDDDAKAMLAQIGYSGTNADHLLAMAHFRYELEALRSVVRRIATLYTGRKINATEAKAGLVGLGMPEAQIDSLLVTLTHQRESEVLVPTPSQVETGFHYNVIDQGTAQSMLEGMGYDPWSAWFVLSARQHGPLPGEPAKPTGGIFGG